MRNPTKYASAIQAKFIRRHPFATAGALLSLFHVGWFIFDDCLGITTMPSFVESVTQCTIVPLAVVLMYGLRSPLLLLLVGTALYVAAFALAGCVADFFLNRWRDARRVGESQKADKDR